MATYMRSYGTAPFLHMYTCSTQLSWLAVSSCGVAAVLWHSEQMQGGHAGSGRVNVIYNRVIRHHNAIAI